MNDKIKIKPGDEIFYAGYDSVFPDESCVVSDEVFDVGTKGIYVGFDGDDNYVELISYDKIGKDVYLTKKDAEKELLCVIARGEEKRKMKCKGCSYLRIGYEDDKDYAEIARARCMATPRGRCLTWAATTYRRLPPDHAADETDAEVLSFNEFEVAEFGIDRVEEFMEDRNAPKWCPLRGDIS